MKIDIGPFVDEGTRKHEIKIHAYDVWSMDVTLSHIIVPMLEKLKEDKHCTPVMASHQYSTDYTSSKNRFFDFYENDNSLAENAAIQEWEIIMNKMIWSFTQIRDGWDKTPYYNGKRGDINYKDVNEHQEKINEGVHLFAKHFESLWD